MHSTASYTCLTNFAEIRIYLSKCGKEYQTIRGAEFSEIRY
jgi:hypothetical protein